MDSPTELQLSHGGQYDAEEYYSLQKQKVMQQNIYYTKYALQFADMQIPELVRVFNSQVHSRAWSSMRAYHDAALLDEFQRRGVDVLAVYYGNTIFFTDLVGYDIAMNRLVTKQKKQMRLHLFLSALEMGGAI